MNPARVWKWREAAIPPASQKFLFCPKLKFQTDPTPFRQGFELELISAHSQPSCPALCRASTPVNRETLRAETVRSAHILSFASCRHVDGHDKRGHDAVR